MLIVEARDLDTDERTVATFEVEMPVDEAGQRIQFAEAVTRLYPEARIRSFGAGAASFLDAQRLVVAHHRRTPEQLQSAPAERSAPVEQQPLFAT